MISEICVANDHDLPRPYRKSYVHRDITAFRDSSLQVAELSFMGKSPRAVYQAAREFLQAHAQDYPGIAVHARCSSTAGKAVVRRVILYKSHESESEAFGEGVFDE